MILKRTRKGYALACLGCKDTGLEDAKEFQR
jgi:hypothetical protein